MKSYTYFFVFFLSSALSHAYCQLPSSKVLFDLNGSTDLMRFLAKDHSKVWRLSPSVAMHVRQGVYAGIEIPFTYVHLRSRSNSATSWGFDPNGNEILVARAVSTNTGVSLFLRKNVLLKNNFISFFQLGVGYHVFKGNARMTSNELFSQHWEGFAPNVRIGLAYKLSERYWLNSNVNYSTANRLNVFVQRGPNAVSLQFGITFLPRF